MQQVLFIFYLQYILSWVVLQIHFQKTIVYIYLAQKILRYSYKVVIMESKFFNDYYSDIKSSNNQNDIFKIMFILKMCKVPLIKSGQNVIFNKISDLFYLQRILFIIIVVLFLWIISILLIKFCRSSVK